MSSEDCVSSRAVTYVPQAPQFFDVLDDLWHPDSNPDGIVNLGLAENVRNKSKWNWYLLISIVFNANGVDRLHKL